MTTAILADDEPLMLAMLREQLEILWPNLEILGEAEDGQAALKLIEVHKPDIAFLDIRMPGLTGLQVANAITTRSRVVFVTAYDTHALEAFEANAVDYVLKPIETPRMAKVLTKLKQAEFGTLPIDAEQLKAVLVRLGLNGPPGASTPSAPARVTWFQVSVGQEIHMAHVEDVRYFEADTKYTRVVTSEFEGLIRMSLKQLLERIDPAYFMQIHRSTVVNRSFIRAVHRQGESMEIEIKGKPERLKVSVPHQYLFRAM